MDRRVQSGQIWKSLGISRFSTDLESFGSKSMWILVLKWGFRDFSGFGDVNFCKIGEQWEKSKNKRIWRNSWTLFCWKPHKKIFSLTKVVSDQVCMDESTSVFSKFWAVFSKFFQFSLSFPCIFSKFFAVIFSKFSQKSPFGFSKVCRWNDRGFRWWRHCSLRTRAFRIWNDSVSARSLQAGRSARNKRKLTLKIIKISENQRKTSKNTLPWLPAQSKNVEGTQH